MYPRTYFETFMRYEAKEQVFVAMPFSAPFRVAFDSVIEPAIKRVRLNGRQLVPRIINRATSGAPDIHEQIFDAILHSRLVIADMTVESSCIGADGEQKWQANANVAYEVGLASAWRNPEDVLLIHQRHDKHTYGFDVQNLRHIPYDVTDPLSVDRISEEIVHALNQSSFLSKMAYQKMIESVSPTAVQFMHQEARRAFPVVAFQDAGMPIMDARIHAVTELLSCGALRNRHVVRQGSDKGVAIIYEWTELGLRMLLSLHAVTAERSLQIREQIDSVPTGVLPPPALRDLPEIKPVEKPPVDMVEAAKVDSTDEAAATM